MAITAEGASEYFKATTFYDLWVQYSYEQKSAAVEMAKREFGRALGRPLREDEPQYRIGDRTREEFAAYEQALYSLMRDAQPKGGGSMVPSLDQDDQQAPVFDARPRMARPAVRRDADGRVTGGGRRRGSFVTTRTAPPPREEGGRHG